MRRINRCWQLGMSLAFLAIAASSPVGWLAWAGRVSAQAEGALPVVRASTRNDTSPPLSDLALKPPEASELREVTLLRLPKAKPSASVGAPPPLDLAQPGAAAMPDPIANFEGTNNVNLVLPPDTNGDVGSDPESGTKYYVQMVNLSYQIWDVTDPADPISLLGPADNNTLWDLFGGPCETTNDGDPIVLFDHLANRWIMTQFALPNFPLGPFYECIAVSQTVDPTGAWHRYEFEISATKLNDYPKFGVWPDAYYMSINQFEEGTLDWAGAGAVAFERDAMLAGDPATMVYFDVGAVTLDFGGMLPADLDGGAPPDGTPNYFVEWDDSSWLGDPEDTLRIWEFSVDWANPMNSTFGANPNFDPDLLISTLNVDPNLCNFGLCIPQPGTAQRLDPISDRLMFRLQYRDFGDYQVLLSNHSVDVDATNHAGIHWFELRDSGSGWDMFQEGVYAPDSEHRWMGSIAMDGAGNVALGYSVSSGTVYPSIRYAGRLAGDPVGTLPQAETSVIAGSGVQTHFSGRWGDYSSMSVDPTDDCTFWYTQEYIETSGSTPWQTRIASFAFPECTGDQADLSITKLADPDPVRPGQELTYTITVDNTGPGPALNVTVSDNLPSGVTLVSVSSSQGDCTALPCNLGTLASGGNATVEIVVSIEENPANPLVNTAEVSSTTPDPNSADNSVTIETDVVFYHFFPLVMKNYLSP